MDTQPVPLGDLPANADLDDFRVSSTVEIQSILRQLIDSNALVTLSGPNGASYTTVLWAADPQRRSISFDADTSSAQLSELLATNEVVAVVYLDRIKIQFDVDNVVTVRGQSTALQAQYPSQLLRFQRRSYFRVKPLMSSSPVAHMQHAAIPEMQLALRVLDISLGGVALSMPKNVPMLPVGVTLRHCHLELDADTQFDVDIVVHHITVLHPENEGARLGCELLGLHGTEERSLQDYIHQTQKRRHALAK